jgi:FkbM family methyltransferase
MAFSSVHAEHIVAVEADPFLVSLLQESAALSGYQITIVAAAAYSRVGLAEFTIAERGRASNYLTDVGGRSQAGGERGRIIIPTITLDSLLDRFQAPSFIKIDVEGAEADVLEGCKRVISKSRPYIYFEASSKSYPYCEQMLLASEYKLSKGAEMNYLATPL